MNFRKVCEHMFLYVGGTTNILWEKIISVHDSKNFASNENHDMLQEYISRHKVVMLTEMDKVKSIITTVDEVYLSAISANTLRKRAECYFG